MSEPTGSPESPDWPEGRGPHLPDAIATIPLGVWPFLAIAVVAAYGRWVVLSTGGFQDPVSVIWGVILSLEAVAAPLLGAVLFYRHPSAYRRFPALTFGAVLFAVAVVADALRRPVLDGISGTDLEFENAILASTGYSVIEALFRVFALTYMAIGLADARRFEDGQAYGRGRVVLVVSALGTSALSAVLTLASVPDPSLPVAILLTAQLLIGLAWVYLGWTAFRGWAAGEEPRDAWGLVATAGIGYLAVSVVVALLNVVLWIVGPSESQVPLVFEFYQLLTAVFAGLWLAMLAAFWLGLPAEPDPAEIDTDGPEPA
jgi:hypothetical protein